MRTRWVAFFGAAMIAGALGGMLLGPTPAGAVAREIIELQTSVNQLIQGQQTMQTAITQNNAVMKTLVEQSLDSVNKLGTSMGTIQKAMQDLQANSGASMDTMRTQLQGLSDNVADLQARLGKLDQKMTDTQNALQSIDSKLAAPQPAPGNPATGSLSGSPGSTAPAGGATGVPANVAGGSAAGGSANPPPSADVLYDSAKRDFDAAHYDLSAQEFQDYLRYYSNSDLASNAQFYLGEIAYSQKQYDQAVTEYDKVLTNYPKSFKLAPARLKKGMALIELNQKPAGVRELREVVKRYPGTEEERRARAKLKDLGVSTSATR